MCIVSENVDEMNVRGKSLLLCIEFFKTFSLCMKIRTKCKNKHLNVLGSRDM